MSEGTVIEVLLPLVRHGAAPPGEEEASRGQDRDDRDGAHDEPVLDPEPPPAGPAGRATASRE